MFSTSSIWITGYIAIMVQHTSSSYMVSLASVNSNPSLLFAKHLTNYLLMSVGSPKPWHFNRCLGQSPILWFLVRLKPWGHMDRQRSICVVLCQFWILVNGLAGLFVFIFWVWFSVSQCLCFVVRMCLVRLKTEGKDGKFMFKKLVQMMWFDVEERIKNLGVGTVCSD